MEMELGIVSGCTATLLILKLAGMVNWGWGYVFAPVLVTLVCFILVSLVAGLTSLLKPKEINKE